jgi:hypothetical protein
MPNEFGLLRPSADGRPAPTEERRLRRRRPTPGAQAPGKADFNRREGLRPTLGLRRPKNVPCAGEGRRLARGAPNEFGLLRPSANGRPAPTEERRSRRRRPTPGASRLKRPISIGEKAFSQRPACTDPSSRRRRPTPGAQAPGKADFNRREGLRPTLGLRRPKNVTRVGEGRRPARGAPNEFGLLRPSADGRPAPTEKRSPRRRRPTPGAQAPERADFNRREGLQPTVGLRRPRNVACVGEGRRLARRAWEGRFQSARRPSADGRPAPTEERSLRRRRPTPGALRLERPISIGAKVDGPCLTRRGPARP